MAKSTKPTFITEIPITTSSWEASILSKRFWAAKQQYNALLGECLKRLRCMRNTKEYKQALVLHKSGSKAQSKELFKQARDAFGYSEYSLYGYCKQWNKKGHFLSIGARISQQIAKRVFNAVKEYEMGKRGKPRFKGYRGLSSIEDNSIDANFRLKGTWINYLGLNLALKYNLKDPIHCHGYHAKKKYVRIVKRSFNGKTRYFAQLACEGMPWVKSKNKASEGIVGLDLGPQTIAMVCPDKKIGHLKVFADELKRVNRENKQLQRKVARQLRINNPQAFEDDKWLQKDKRYRKKQGKVIKGKPIRNRSKALLKNQHKLADIARRQAAFRKSQHGKLVNELLKLGNHIKTEKLSYKAFQKLFGKSIGLRAPGMFVSMLKRKAENAGGKVEECSTWKTKLSQTCHCGKQEKKPLTQRWHKCPCGVQAQRDLYSAFLACYVDKETLMVDQAQKAWLGMDIVLRTAMSEIKQATSRHLPASLGLKTG